MRTLSTELQAEQEAVSNTPYTRIYVNDTDYSDRLLYNEHHEEAYRDRATVILRNDDRALDIATVDLTGKFFRIGYGHITGEAVAEPNGNNDTAEYAYAAPLWVKNQWVTSMEGIVVCQLYCTGAWAYLREQRVMAYGSAPYYNFQFNATHTIYELIEEVVETAMGWSLAASPTVDDGILNDFKPIFDVNEMPYENAASVLYRLISMTKCYLRIKANYGYDYPEVEIVYPQEADTANENYYDNQGHYFFEYTEKVNLLIPNSIAVFCNQGEDGTWTTDDIITGTSEDAVEIAKYTEVLQPYMDGTITNQTDADNRAAAILTRIKAEQLAGKLIIPHDSSVELYDKVTVHDARGI